MRKKKRSLTGYGNHMIKELFRKMTIPQIFSALSGTLCMLVDSIIVGRVLGVECMSAYGLALPLLTLLIALGTMISCGVQVVCAKALGFGDLDEASACYSTSIAISLIMAAVGVFLVFFACDPICILLGAGGTDRTVFVQTQAFLKGYFLGAPFFFLSQITAPYLQAMGKRMILFYSVLVMTLTDIVFDLLNQYVFHSGMFGIGLASGLSYLAALLVCIGFFLKKDCPFRLSMGGIRLKTAREILRAGSPVILTQIFYVMRIYASNLILLELGGIYAVAAFSVISTLANMPYSVGLGAGNVAMLLSSLFFSEEDRASEKELVKSMIPFSFWIITGVVILLECFSPWIILQYFEPHAPVYSIAHLGFCLFIPEMIPCCLNTVMKMYLQGIRKPWFTNLIAFLESFFLVMFAWLLSRRFGLPGFWLGAVFGQAATFGVISVLIWNKYGRVSFSADAYCCLEPGFGVDPSDCMVFSITGRKGSDSVPSPETAESYENTIVKISENMVEFCRQKGLSEKLCMLIGLSVEEMGLNIIRYGFSDNRRTHFLNIRAVVRDSRCVIQFRDNCVSFDPTNYLELHRNNDPVSHFGIRMIMTFVKDAIYVNTFGLNNLTLTM